jgi:hypothetical protein
MDVAAGTGLTGRAAPTEVTSELWYQAFDRTVPRSGGCDEATQAQPGIGGRGPCYQPVKSWADPGEQLPEETFPQAQVTTRVTYHPTGDSRAVLRLAPDWDDDLLARRPFTVGTRTVTKLMVSTGDQEVIGLVPLPAGRGGAEIEVDREVAEDVMTYLGETAAADRARLSAHEGPVAPDPGPAEQRTMKSRAERLEAAGDYREVENILGRVDELNGGAGLLLRLVRQREAADLYGEAERAADFAQGRGDCEVGVTLTELREKAGRIEDADRIARRALQVDECRAPAQWLLRQHTLAGRTSRARELATFYQRVEPTVARVED